MITCKQKKPKKLSIVPRVCSSSMLHVSSCVFCSMSILFDYMCMRLPLSPWSIVGVPSRQALLGFLITAPPSVCVPDVISASLWIPNQKKLKTDGHWASTAPVWGRFGRGLSLEALHKRDHLRLPPVVCLVLIPKPAQTLPWVQVEFALSRCATVPRM